MFGRATHPTPTAARAEAEAAASATPAPLAAGDVVGGLTVTAPAGEHDGWTEAEARTADGRPARLWVADARDRERRAAVRQLAALRAAPRAAELALAPLEGAGRDADRVFVARRPPAGDTLAQRLADGPLDRVEAVRLLSQVAGALDSLRAFGIPHAHLTPAAIRLSRGRPAQAVLEDYGFPPAPLPSPTGPAVLDIVDYLAPEVARGAAPGTPGEVYALACILVECLTGWPPFPADRPLLVLEAHRTEPPPRLAEATGLPPELDRILQTALHKRPEHRQQSAAGLLRAVQRAIGRQRFAIPVVHPEAPRKAPARKVAAPAAATPPRVAPAPAAPPRRRRPLLAGTRRLAPSGVAAAALLLFSTAAGYATATGRPQDTTATRAPSAPLGAAATALADPSAAQRAAVVAAVDRAIAPLAAERVAGRRALRAARNPHAQALAALRVAEAYGTARRALPPRAGLAAAAPAATLDGTLRAVDRAYRRLAGAAVHRNAPGYGRAAQAIVAGEAALDDTLRRLGRRPA